MRGIFWAHSLPIQVHFTLAVYTNSEMSDSWIINFRMSAIFCRVRPLVVSRAARTSLQNNAMDQCDYMFHQWNNYCMAACSNTISTLVIRFAVDRPSTTHRQNLWRPNRDMTRRNKKALRFAFCQSAWVFLCRLLFVLVDYFPFVLILCARTNRIISSQSLNKCNKWMLSATNKP